MADRLPDWGAVRLAHGRVRFRLWAPGCADVTLRLGGSDLPMEPVGEGWFERAAEAPDGAAYAFVLPDGRAVPDPAARRQDGDVHGPSLVAGPDYPWQADWPGRPWEEAVICELHIGTFTPEGTFRAAIERLDALADTGFTAIEIMPVAQFAGALCFTRRHAGRALRVMVRTDGGPAPGIAGTPVWPETPQAETPVRIALD